MFILFSCLLDQKFTNKTVFAKYYLKLSLMFLKLFLIFAQFQPHVSYKKPVIYKIADKCQRGH